MSTKDFHFGDWLFPQNYTLDHRSHPEIEKPTDWKNTNVNKKNYRPHNHSHSKDSLDMGSGKSYKEIDNLTKQTKAGTEKQFQYGLIKPYLDGVLGGQSSHSADVKRGLVELRRLSERLKQGFPTDSHNLDSKNALQLSLGKIQRVVTQIISHCQYQSKDFVGSLRHIQDATHRGRRSKLNATMQGRTVPQRHKLGRVRSQPNNVTLQGKTRPTKGNQISCMQQIRKLRQETQEITRKLEQKIQENHQLHNRIGQLESETLTSPTKNPFQNPQASKQYGNQFKDLSRKLQHANRQNSSLRSQLKRLKSPNRFLSPSFNSNANLNLDASKYLAGHNVHVSVTQVNASLVDQFNRLKSQTHDLRSATSKLLEKSRSQQCLRRPIGQPQRVPDLDTSINIGNQLPAHFVKNLIKVVESKFDLKC